MSIFYEFYLTEFIEIVRPRVTWFSVIPQVLDMEFRLKILIIENNSHDSA